MKYELFLYMLNDDLVEKKKSVSTQRVKPTTLNVNTVYKNIYQLSLILLFSKIGNVWLPFKLLFTSLPPNLRISSLSRNG